ncbi:MAG: bifunctional chorismate mutase/prephenate dehydratase [Bacillota bacterium]|jgi:chorismate mutase/prephenate dehydratase
MSKLENARKQINAIDAQMADLFVQRMTAVADVVAYKAENNLPVLDEKREAEVLAKNAARLDNTANAALKPYYAEFLRNLMDVSKSWQKAALNKNTVGYQGTNGAFSCIAAKKIYPNAKAVAYPCFENVFNAVENDEVAYGVIPFENSYTGEVGEILDLLLSYDLNIINSFDLSINQNLLGVKGAVLADVAEVYSHQQALSQCHDYLQGYGWQAVPYSNTALAAEYVAKCGDKTKAAIASLETAELFGLDILAKNINTSVQNTTRFMVISKEENFCGNRFNMLFTVGHEAGQLAKIMSIFGDFGYNLESIKSRPMKNLPWQYYFYAEIIGNLKDRQTAALIAKLRETCNLLKILGSYSIQ